MSGQNLRMLHMSEQNFMWRGRKEGAEPEEVAGQAWLPSHLTFEATIALAGADAVIGKEEIQDLLGDPRRLRASIGASMGVELCSRALASAYGFPAHLPDGWVASIEGKRNVVVDATVGARTTFRGRGRGQGVRTHSNAVEEGLVHIVHQVEHPVDVKVVALARHRAVADIVDCVLGESPTGRGEGG